ncbi:MAG: universal stress protein UspA [Dyadobacter sp. 50-39]|uniref:universal stress protein n=1 Tax=Dyadobacter sp. 50-39 TaxID=1895756 RepID=UPI00095C3DDD|nr:universal stress protein [Dyadobacter sp. 50-39]OJV22635.1 MAG: universal stress protein UspA [Dyadobacter sp. 50-39]
MADSTDRFRILVPCDFSEAFWQALETCATLDWPRPVELLVLTVGDPLNVSDKRQASEHRLAEWHSAWQHKFETRILEATGRFVNAVLDAVGAHDVDMIVVGTRGSRGWDGVFVGSHAEKIVRLSPVPVLTVQQRPGPPTLRDIVVPIDIDHIPGELSACLAKLSAWLGGRFHLLHVESDPAKSEEELLATLDGCSAKLGLSYAVNAVEQAESVAEGVLKYAGRIGADLIVMGTMGDADPAHMFRPSFAADVVNHSRIPVLACPLRHRLVSEAH